MVDLQLERSRAMLEASINVVPSCFKSLPRTSLHRVGGAPRGLDHPVEVEGVDGECDLGRYIFESAGGV